MFVYDTSNGGKEKKRKERRRTKPNCTSFPLLQFLISHLEERERENRVVRSVPVKEFRDSIKRFYKCQCNIIIIF